MSRTTSLALLTALALLLGASGAGAAPEDPVRAHLERVAEDEGIPGMAVAVVPAAGGHRSWTLGEDGDGAPVDASTPFLLGSVSKSFTAATVHDLVDRGRLDLDDRLGDLLADHGIPDERADSITVEQLLTHTSGLSTDDGLAHADRFDNEPGAVARQARGLGDVTLTGRPGSGYEYSDLNYLLLGAVVEEVGRGGFARQVSAVARSAGVDLLATPGEAEALPPGHRQVLGRAVTFASDYDASGTPYGYLGADLDGATAWAHAQLGGHGIDDDALAAMHAGSVDTGSGDRYGQGWRVGQLDGERMIHHTGATPGYFAHVLLLPERDVAVVVLANSYSEARAPSLAVIAQDVARIEAGAEPVGAGSDPTLAAAPFVILGLAVLGLAVAIVLLRRPGRRRRLVALVLAVPLVSLGLAAPGLLGHSSEQLRLWAPDIGWGLWGLATAWTVVAAVALLGLVRGRIARGRSDQADVSPARGG